MQVYTDLTETALVINFVTWLSDRLQINPDKIHVYEENGLDCYGMCIDHSEVEYEILIKTRNRTITDIFNTISHEMIHVKQHIKENLGHWLETCSDTPYMQRWWEIEAFSNSFDHVQEFVKEYF